MHEQTAVLSTLKHRRRNHWDTAARALLEFGLVRRILSRLTSEQFASSKCATFASLLDLPRTNLSHHRLPSGLRTDSTASWLDRLSWASRFLFLVFFISLCCGSVRQIKLAMLAFGRTYILRKSEIVEVEVNKLLTLPWGFAFRPRMPDCAPGPRWGRALRPAL